MKKRIHVTVLLVLVLGLGVPVQAAVFFSDNFDGQATVDSWDRHNYQGWYEDNVLAWPNPGGDWVIGDWDGYQSLPSGDDFVSPTLLAYNYVDSQLHGFDEPNLPWSARPGADPNNLLNGVLRFTSCGSFWADQGNTGPFLYKNVTGDFTAKVQVVACDNYFNNMGGLMVRAANGDGMTADGANENWVYLNFFPLYGVGNNIRNCTNGVSPELGRHGYPGDPYLMIERVGDDFYFSTSPDGDTYSSLLTELSDPNDPNSPTVPVAVSRPDLPDELEVGIFQANFAGDWVGSMDFDNFSIEVPDDQVADANE